jgi:hypothetical protein
MSAVAWDYATGASTGRTFFPFDDILDAERGRGAITVEQICTTNAAFAPVEMSTDVSDRMISQLVCGTPTRPSYLSAEPHQQAYVKLTASNMVVGWTFCGPMAAPSRFSIGTQQVVSSNVSGGTARQAGISYVNNRTIEQAGFLYSSGGVARRAVPLDFSGGTARWSALSDFSSGTAHQANVNVTVPDEPASTSLGRSAIELHPSLSRCLLALYQRQAVLSEVQAAALKRQLRVLLQEEDELRSANITVSMPSLHGLIDFLSEHPTCALPSLSITQTGYFAASWSPRERAKLTIVFHRYGIADWIASDLDATPPVHQKDALANRQGELAAWTNA